MDEKPPKPVPWLRYPPGPRAGSCRLACAIGAVFTPAGLASCRYEPLGRLELWLGIPAGKGPADVYPVMLAGGQDLLAASGGPPLHRRSSGRAAG